MIEKCPRVMIAAVSSGSGKTLITCGLLQALVNRGHRVASFKCGPDYVDPIFHRRIIGTKSKNLDTFFTDPETTRYLFCDTAREHRISVIEGILGFYDSFSGNSTSSSSYDLSNTLECPVILVIDCKGVAMTIAAVVKGIKEFRENNIKGVILNRISEDVFQSVKESIESETWVKVYGYVPDVMDLVIKTRHLGIIIPDEIDRLKRNLTRLANVLEKTIDVDAIIDLADTAPDMEHVLKKYPVLENKVRIAVASDDTFCFTYEDNLRILRYMGAELVFFSPTYDDAMPENVDGLILSGGYPELHAPELGMNIAMRDSIKEALDKGMPCIAECGGYMFLNDGMEDNNGSIWSMVGFLKGKCIKTNKLMKFGYVTLTAKEDNILLEKGESIKGHEFHFWECTDEHSGCTAIRSNDSAEYDCVDTDGKIFAGFPHLYFYSNPHVPFRFLTTCEGFKKERTG